MKIGNALLIAESATGQSLLEIIAAVAAVTVLIYFLDWWQT